MVQAYDTAVEEQDLDDGNSMELEVDTSDEETSNVVLFVDDGTAGNNPPSYDLDTEIKRPEVNPTEFLFYADETATTSRSWTDPAYPDEMRYTITNQSGGTATFRAVLVAFQGEN